MIRQVQTRLGWLLYKWGHQLISSYNPSFLIIQTLNQFWFLKRGLGWETRNCQQTKNNFDFHKEKFLVLIKLDKLAVKLSGLGFLNFSFHLAFFRSTPSDCDNILSNFKTILCCFNYFCICHCTFSRLDIIFQSWSWQKVFSGVQCVFCGHRSLCLDLINHSGFLEHFQNIKIFLQNSILQLHYSPSWHSALECRLVKHLNENLDLCIQLLVLQLLFFSL